MVDMALPGPVLPVLLLKRSLTRLRLSTRDLSLLVPPMEDLKPLALLLEDTSLPVFLVARAPPVGKGLALRLQSL